MATESRTPPLRADAERNRRRLIEAATALFHERGMDASIAEIRDRAGVGQGTVFRHFPTKEHLAAEVMRERMAELTSLAREQLAVEDPAAALRDFMVRAAQTHAIDQAMYRAICAANALSVEDERELRGTLFALIEQLVRRAQAAGAVRDDLVAEDVLTLVNAATASTEALAPVAPDLWRRYLDVILDGLRPEGAHPLSQPPPTGEQFDAIREL